MKTRVPVLTRDGFVDAVGKTKDEALRNAKRIIQNEADAIERERDKQLREIMFAQYISVSA
jgi:predicted RNase H-like HicB family nuclease